jgi:IS1 family transposase
MQKSAAKGAVVLSIDEKKKEKIGNFANELLSLLRLFDINIIYSDNNYAYRLHITGIEAVTGKENTQKIERKQHPVDVRARTPGRYRITSKTSMRLLFRRNLSAASPMK